LKHGHKEEFTSSVQGIHANAGHTAYIKQQRKKKVLLICSQQNFQWHKNILYDIYCHFFME